MLDLGALQAKLSAEPSGFVRGFSNAIGALSGFSGAVGLAGGALAILAGVGFKKATDAAQVFEDNLVRLNKVAGSDFGGPIARGIRELSTNLPVASQELFDVAESAVRLGIRGTNNVNNFVEVMGKVGTVTDMSAQAAAEDFARLATVMDLPIEKVENLAATANELSDSMATSFREVVKSSGELAPVLAQMGVLPEQTIAFAAAQNEVNVSVRRGAQRLRSFLQQLVETRRAANIAPALNMTIEGFQELVRETPVDAIRAVLEGFREGGQRARQLSEAFDSAGRLGAQSLSQNIEGLELALTKANAEMEAATSLNRQFSEFVNSTSARQQILTNRVQAFTEEIGEGLLPLKAGVIGFFASFVQGMRNIRRELDPTLDLLDMLPDRVTEALVEIRRAQLEAEGVGARGRGSFFDIDKKAAEDIRDMGIAEAVNAFAGSMETAQEQARLLSTFMDNLLPQIEEGNITWNEAVNMLSKYAAAMNSIREQRPAPDPFEDPDDIVERLKGMNLEFAKNQLRERFAIDLKNISDEAAQLLLTLAEQQTEFREGEEAARRFALELQGIPSNIIDIVTAGEQQIASAEAYRGVLDELEDRNRSLSETEQDAFSRRLDAMEELEPAQRRVLETLFEMIRGREKEKELEEEFNNIREDLLDNLLELERGEEALFRTQMERLGLLPGQIEELMLIREKINAIEEQNDAEAELAKERERAQKRIDRLIEQTDITSMENRFKMLDETISGVADNIVNIFDLIEDKNKSFLDSMLDTIRNISREFMSMMIRHQFMQAIEGTDWFSKFIGIGSTAAGAAGGGAGGGGGAGFMHSPPSFDRSSGFRMEGDKKGSNSVNLSVRQDFNINTIDAKGVDMFIRENAGQIASETAKQFSRSRALKDLSNA